MELSSEDTLRLNVLVANAQAIRIDEGAMAVYGLSGDQEMKVALNPNRNPDKYLGGVRELLSGAVLGSPGGYPVFLRRWTRMGQVDNQNLDKLLMLGEPEAVVAVTCSPSLDDELARRAWWILQDAENARRMLSNPRIAAGEMGPVLAEFLVEYLPFETEHQHVLDTVRLILRPGLISDERRQRLWEAGRSRKTYRVGFLAAVPGALPERVDPRPDRDAHLSALTGLIEAVNPDAALLGRLLDAEGRTFMEVAADALRRPADQDVYSALLNAIGRYFGPVRREQERFRELEMVRDAVQAAMDAPDEPLAALLQAVPGLAEEVGAMLRLAHVDEALVIPVFSLTDAVGSVMRKKVEHISRAILDDFAILLGREP